MKQNFNPEISLKILKKIKAETTRKNIFSIFFSKIKIPHNDWKSE
jgi:hypothetical protein